MTLGESGSNTYNIFTAFNLLRLSKSEEGKVFSMKFTGII